MNSEAKQTKDFGLLRSKDGQMTIFIVLIFQVLFVFFAMVANIGLVVHEKINVQNAADIAAAYGAQKQAEVLNAIGHSNYQIRQAWKLLAFRVRVFGDFGRLDGGGLDEHPVRKTLQGSGIGPDAPWPNVSTFDPSLAANPSGVYPPMVCVTHPSWINSDSPTVNNDDNLCKSTSGQLGTQVRALPPVRIIFPGIDNLVKSQFDNLNDRILDACSNSGLVNWMMAAKFLVSYKFDVYQKLVKIRELKRKLESGLDIEGNSIEQGVRVTFNANLTQANSIVEFKWMNPFESASPDYLESWLRPIRVLPTIFFISNQSAGSCVGERRGLYEITETQINSIPGDDRGLYGLSSDSELWRYSLEAAGDYPMWDDASLIQSNVGVEKNPWVVIYSGVEVITSASKPFFPAGNGPPITARAFAQPFGSTVGPWFKRDWQPGAYFSSGDNTDPLLPEVWRGGAAAPAIQNRNVPNYSRYPGDSLGLNSQKALSEIGAAWRNIALSQIKIEDYNTVPLSAINGGLSISEGLSGRLEALSVAPNLFDMFYYNIDPNAERIFNTRGATPLANIQPDYRESASLSGIKGQIQSTINQGLAPLVDYRAQDWQHLLNAWVANDPSDYSAPNSRFGVCTTPLSEDASPTSGDCIAGGRSGYSVKIVSEDYLTSDQYKVSDTISGSIVNPPGN